MSRPLRVLLLEDRQDDARLILHELRQAGFDPFEERVETELEFLSCLEPTPDLILADYHLPQFDALRALRLVRERGLDVPVIVVTGALGDEAAVECLKQGACDYLLKDRLARLGQAVVHALEQKQARDARRRAEEEIKIAKEVAEAANRAKDQFLAWLSHELRSPLNPVLLAVSAMLDNPGTVDEMRSMLAMIKDNVELEVRLIDDLLDVTRIAQGKLHLNLEAVDVHVVIRRALETCCDAIQAGRFQLALDLSAGEHHVEGDPARLQQLFWNLINNAAKFAPGGGAISIRTRNEPGPGPGATGRRLIVEVSDTGIGIDSAALPRIFRDFEQGDASIARRFGGLGLGLAISRSVAEAHGGRLTAASDGKDRGATFTLELAARTGEIHEPAAPSPALCADLGAPAVEDPAGRGQQGHLAVPRLGPGPASACGAGGRRPGLGPRTGGRGGLRPADQRHRVARRHRAGAHERDQENPRLPGHRHQWLRLGGGRPDERGGGVRRPPDQAHPVPDPGGGDAASGLGERPGRCPVVAAE